MGTFSQRLEYLFRVWRYANTWEYLCNKHLFRRRNVIAEVLPGLPIWIQDDCSDAYVVHEVVENGIYDDAILASAKGENFSYINLGANIGAFDVEVNRLLAPRLKCLGVAVEMNTVAFGRLVVNLDLNRIQGVWPMNVAVWDWDGMTQVSWEERDTGQACTGAGAGKGHPVPLMAWSRLFDDALLWLKGPVDLLKVDIEGAEARVLPAIHEQQFKQILNIVIEAHGSECRAKTESILRSQGYHCEWSRPGPGDTRLYFWSR